MIALLWALAGPAVAAEPAERDIFDHCQALERALTAGGGDRRLGGDGGQLISAGVCNGFVWGYVAGTSDKQRYCLPSFYPSDVGLVFNAFVKRQPVWRMRNPGDALEAALIDAFPCKGK